MEEKSCRARPPARRNRAEERQLEGVEASYKGRGKWYSGGVLGVRPSRTLDGAFDQQSEMTHVERMKVDYKGAEAS